MKPYDDGGLPFKSDHWGLAFKEVKDTEKEVQVNVAMMRRVVRAVKKLSLCFKFLVYPGGTRVSLSMTKNPQESFSLTKGKRGTVSTV
jgi:hypothetical protein